MLGGAMKVPKQPAVYGKGKQTPPPVDRVVPHRLRLPPWAAGLLFAAAAIPLFVAWWNRFPIIPELFGAYWKRDLKYLTPEWGVCLSTWGGNLWSTQLVIGFELASWALGRRMLAWLFRRPPGGIWNGLLATGLGNGLLGTLALSLGLAGLLDTAFLRLGLTGACAWAAWELWRSRGARDGWRAAVEETRVAAAKFGVLGWGLMAYVAFIVVTNYVPAMEPEWFYDSLVYHLAVPEQWLIEHKVCLLPHTFFSNFPFLHEMQYLILLAAGGDVPCKLLHWFNGVLSAAAAGALAAAFFGPRAGAFAAAAYLSQPTMRFLQHVTMVELGITWFETLATAAVIRAAGWWPSGRGGARGAWLCAAGCFLGYAQGTKYIGLFCSVILLAGWLAATWPRPRALAQPGSSR
ncbi:MAG: hypothetical protein AAB368_12840, partial [bacterium]